MGLRATTITLITLTVSFSGCGATSGGGSGGASSAARSAGPTGDAEGARPVFDFCPSGPYASPGLEVTPTLIHQGTGSGLFEGPVWISELEALFFSDMDFSEKIPPSTIHRLTPPSTVVPAIANAGSNGLAVDADGMIVACTHDTQSVSRFDPKTGARTAIVRDYDGKPFNSPNDVTIRSDGTLYFTDPDWQAGGRPGPGLTGVYCRRPGMAAVLIDGSLNKPNGISLSPDQTVLYVGDVSGRVSAYAVTADCSPTARRDFANVTEPDGMAVDCTGNLYVTSHTPGIIHVFAPSGEPLGQITVAPKLTNLAFGGADHTTLYASAAKGLYAIGMNVAGFAY